MSLRTAWSAARSALVTKVTTAWSITATVNSLQRALVVADLPHARLYTDGPVAITPETPVIDKADITFNVHGVWAWPSGTTDLEDWAMEKIESLRDAIASDWHLSGACTDCTVTSVSMTLPDLEANDKWIEVVLEVAVRVDFNRDGT